MTARRKLIEVALPLEAINIEAERRKKKAPKGYPPALHKWWAQRPVATARAILFAQLVDDPNSDTAPPAFVEACKRLTVLTPGNDPKKPRNVGRIGPFATIEDSPRHRLFDFIAELVEWENTTNEAVLKLAHELILLSTDGNPPPVLDPFSGGCTIPLEAQRLGLEAHGSDLNPVAVMIGKASIEIPPRFAGRPPVHPSEKSVQGGTFKGAQGLAADVRYYGTWMKERAQERIGHLYPKAKLPDGGEATVIAWLWARTIRCPNPVCGADMQLVSSFDLSTKAGKRAWAQPEIDRSTTPPRVSYTIGTGTGKTPDAPKTGRGANFRCLCCGTSVDDKYVKAEGMADRMGAQLMAMVAEGQRSRFYLAPTHEMEAAAQLDRPDNVPSATLPNDPRNFWTVAYGLNTFEKLFTPRQLVALTTFSDLVEEARTQIKADALLTGLPDDGVSLRDSGAGAGAYSEAIALYLSFARDRLVDYMSSLASWRAKDNAMRSTYSKQSLPMIWDYAEANPFGSSGAGFSSCISVISDCIDMLPASGFGTETQHNASTSLVIDKPLISTDPPYYDNIGYADLSDYFYVWMRQTLRFSYPEIFNIINVPKIEELVATPYRHGGRDKAETFFLKGMTQAIREMAKQGNSSYPAAIYYAFKQSETTEAGISSTGWATFLEAVIVAGYCINGTWPVRTEGSNRSIGIGANALASSIVLVCRPRLDTAILATRTDFLRELRRELPAALAALTGSNIAPVDMAQASIGPGMAVYSRYKEVLEADGTRMPVRVALQLINAALDEYFSEQEGHLDEDTRFAVTWFETHGMTEASYGDAETLATARGVSVRGVEEAGLIAARGGKVRLLRRDELPEGWTPGKDRTPTTWEAVQHLTRALENGGEEQAGALMATLGTLAESARELAYRLYGICERKGWSAEGQAYNALVASWSGAAEAASKVNAPKGPQQGGLFGEGD